MKVVQVLNNNAVLLRRGGHEVIALAKGIGVRKRRGEQMEESEVERIYIPDSFDVLDHFSYLLAHTDPEMILLVQRIINHVERELGIKATDSIALTLLDHIDFTLKRVAKGQFIKSPLYWDVKRFYPKHLAVGREALHLIHAQTGVELPDDEAVSLAVHFINMEDVNADTDAMMKMIRGVGDIVSIVEKHYQMKLDEDSLNYMRFVTHLQYFVHRIEAGGSVSGENSMLDLYQQVARLYPQAFDATQKIRVYIQSQFGVTIGADEETYLMIHIQRVTEREEIR